MLAARLPLAAVTALALAVSPTLAGTTPDAVKTTASKSSNSNLKWRAPKAAVTTDTLDSSNAILNPFADEAAPAAPKTAEAKASPKASSTSNAAPVSKSAAKKSADNGTTAMSQTATSKSMTSQSEMSFKTEPAELPAEPAAKPIKTVRVRKPMTVQRLADAAPAPQTSTTLGGNGSTLTIKLASHDEPQLDPFGDDQVPTLELVRKPTRAKAVHTAMQDRSAVQDPFGDAAPRLEQVPKLAPQRDSANEPTPPTELAQALPYNCPTPREYVKKLSDISTNIAAEPGEFPVECGLGDEQFVPRNFQSTLFAWKASSLCHKPLYFEDVELERYGQTCSPFLQPIISATKFYLTLPILPYMMGVEPPLECIYPLGYYRPGDCAPFIIPPVPISLRGALLEAGVWVAGVALVP
ncbi:MAG TPA: hypothetical protein VGN12_10020 [Pirellulales bacterium]